MDRNSKVSNLFFHKEILQYDFIHTYVNIPSHKMDSKLLHSIFGHDRNCRRKCFSRETLPTAFNNKRDQFFSILFIYFFKKRQYLNNTTQEKKNITYELLMANDDLLIHAAKINLTREREGGIAECKGEIFEGLNRLFFVLA
jgi:hypothetical protein